MICAGISCTFKLICWKKCKAYIDLSIRCGQTMLPKAGLFQRIMMNKGGCQSSGWCGGMANHFALNSIWKQGTVREVGIVQPGILLTYRQGKSPSVIL